MRHIDLFSGIGGFALAASRVWPDHEVLTFCEKDKYCQKVLKKHWPDVPICEDIYDFDGRKYQDIDIITAGYPCQPFSTASRGRIVADDMSGFAIKAVYEAFPKFVVFENVQERTIRHCEEQLISVGYSAVSMRVGSHEIGADHKRNRWWLIAHAYYESEFLSTIHAKVAELPKMERSVWGPENYSRAVGVRDGIPNRMDRLRALGNAIVPQVAEQIFTSIKEVS